LAGIHEPSLPLSLLTNLSFNVQDVKERMKNIHRQIFTAIYATRSAVKFINVQPLERSMQKPYCQESTCTEACQKQKCELEKNWKGRAASRGNFQG
jgi:hypothetical protein